MRTFQRIEAELQLRGGHGVPVPTLLQFLGTLRFYATGSFQSVVGELFSISQPTMSRMILRVSKVNAGKRPGLIKFPVGNHQVANQRTFQGMGGIPGVIGAIDCTHVIRFNRQVHYNLFAVNV